MKHLLVVSLVAGLFVPSSALAQEVTDPTKAPSEPCSVRACTVAKRTLTPGQTFSFTTSQKFGVWNRTQDFSAYLNGRVRDSLKVVEGLSCGAYYYGAGLVVKVTMPRCETKRRSAIHVRVTNGSSSTVKLRLTAFDAPSGGDGR